MESAPRSGSVPTIANHHIGNAQSPFTGDGLISRVLCKPWKHTANTLVWRCRFWIFRPCVAVQGRLRIS